MIPVRGSEVGDFLRCRLKHKYRWVDQWIPKKPNGKLFFGTLFHRFIEVLYQTKNYTTAFDAMVELWENTDTSLMEQIELDELWKMADTIAHNYVDHYWDNDREWTILATELRFEIPLDEQVVFTGTIDLVYEEDGRIYLMDHKTTASIQSYTDRVEMDRQISRYMWALQEIQKGNGFVYDKTGNRHPATVFAKRLQGKEIMAFIYNIILKDFPEPPKVLKDGSLSKAKNQKTTYELYVKAIEDNFRKNNYYKSPMEEKRIFEECRTGEYAEILGHLKEFPKEFFKRVEVHRLQPEIDAAIQEFYYTAVDIAGIRSHYERGAKEYAYRNITKDCSWDCDHKAVCVAGMDGSNVDFLLNTLYYQEEK